MSQSIQNWTKESLWKTAFKKFEEAYLPKADHTTLNFLKAAFHKFYLVHS